MNESQNQIPSFIKDECINKFEKDISIKIFTHLDKVIKQSHSIDDFSDLDEDPNKIVYLVSILIQVFIVLLMVSIFLFIVIEPLENLFV